LIPQEFAFMTQTFAFLFVVMGGIKAVLGNDHRAFNLILLVGAAGSFALFAFLLDLMSNSSCKGALRWKMRELESGEPSPVLPAAPPRSLALTIVILVVFPGYLVWVVLQNLGLYAAVVATNIYREARGTGGVVERPAGPPRRYWQVLEARRRFPLERLLLGRGGVDPSATRWYIISAHVYLVVWVALTVILLSFGPPVGAASPAAPPSPLSPTQT
jgi:hypothetical protein